MAAFGPHGSRRRGGQGNSAAARVPPHQENRELAPLAGGVIGAAVHRQHDHLGADVWSGPLGADGMAFSN
jgi:hypothetical protein